MRPILPFLQYILRRRQFDADLREELASHHAMQQRELEARGYAPADATRLAQRALGSRALAEDQARDVWRPRWLQGLGGDVRVALRSLSATKIVTSVAALSLALGIGANTAIFSLVNSLLLRPLPVSAPDRLALVSSTDITAYRPTFSFATFDQIRRRRLFDDIGAFTTCCSQSTITIDETRELVYREFFSGDFFRTLGLHASVGRLITPADDVDGSKPDGQIVVISDRLWKRRFGGNANVIGHALTVDHAPLTIVGVLPADFLGLEVGRTFDIAMPVGTRLGASDLAGYDERTAPILNILIRRYPGQTLAAAVATLRAVQPDVRDDSMPKAFNADFLKSPFVLEPMSAGTSTLRERFARPLIAILVVVLLVLLIACANIANLLLARSTARHHELSVRVALGASRWRLARQLLVESVALSAIGTAGGVLFAPAAVRLLVSQLSVASAPVVLDLSLDWRVGVFTATVMVVTVVLFGVAPALRATKVAPTDALRDRMTSGNARLGRARGGVADSLIIGQVALSLTLVVAAGLFIRTFEQLGRVPLGFEGDHVLGVTVDTQSVAAAERNVLYHRLAHAVENVAGVTHAGGSINPPLRGFLQGDLVVSAPDAKPAPDAERISQSDFVTPGSFAAYGIPLRAGRDFDNRDTIDSQKVMIVNEAFVRRLLSGRNAIGEGLTVTARLLPEGDFSLGTLTIVGVVGDAVYHSLRERPRPALYMPLRQYGAAVPQLNFYLAIRTTGPPTAALERQVAATVDAVNADLTLKFEPIKAEVDAALAQDRLVAMLSGFFGGLALLLAGLGLYGVTAYAVSRRRIELGIRMALGAAPGTVVQMVLWRVARLVGIGVLIGVLASLWASRFVAALLYGLGPRDRVTLVGAVLVLSGVAICAGSVPAWRAARIDPAVTLRYT